MSKTVEILEADELQQSISEFTDILRAPVYSSLLTIGFNSGLFEKLKNKPMGTSEVSNIMEWHRDVAETVLTAMVHCNFLNADSINNFSCTKQILGLLSVPSFWTSVINDWNLLHQDLTLFNDVLSTGNINHCKLFQKWAYKAKTDIDQQQSTNYSQDMNASSQLHSTVLLDALNIDKDTRLLDIGGGYGEFVNQVVNKYPNIKAAVFDLPDVQEGFESKFRELPIEKNVDFFSGDFFNSEFPRFGNIVTLNRVLWDWKDPEAEAIVKNIYQALPEHGEVVIYEAMYIGDSNIDKRRAASAIQHMFFGGKIRSVKEIEEILYNCGFLRTTQLNTKLPGYCAIIGIK
jgi:cyclopropane fatty-acyl-phospholipid synthase-like methyltransferase